MPEANNIKGTFVVAEEGVNEAGWPSYRFGHVPYVHHSSQGAEQEARRLARRKGTAMAVFKKICTVEVESELTGTHAFDLEELAGTLARRLQESNRHMDIVSCRCLIDLVIKDMMTR